MKRTALLLLTAGLLVFGAACQKRSGDGPSGSDRSLKQLQDSGVLRWGTDVVGGIPYVYEDPRNPGTYIGFEMDLAKILARELGVDLRLEVRAWDTLIPELQRGSFDMAMNGIEDTEERSRMVLFSRPYFVYSQQLTVRKATGGVKALDDLVGKRVATLSGTAAEDILRGTEGIEVVTNPEIIYSYKDLEAGKVDAVLLDTPIAAAYGAANPALENVGESFGEGRYVIAFRQEDIALRKAVDAALDRVRQNGELKAIYVKWGIFDLHQTQIGIL